MSTVYAARLTGPICVLVVVFLCATAAAIGAHGDALMLAMGAVVLYFTWTFVGGNALRTRVSVDHDALRERVSNATAPWAKLNYVWVLWSGQTAASYLPGAATLIFSAKNGDELLRLTPSVFGARRTAQLLQTVAEHARKATFSDHASALRDGKRLRKPWFPKLLITATQALRRGERVDFAGAGFDTFGGAIPWPLRAAMSYGLRKDNA